MTRSFSRRQFLTHSTAAGAIVVGSGYWSGVAVAADPKGPNDKLNIGMIGTAGQARFSIGGVQHENIAAVCDIDERNLDKAVKDFPQAKRYTDFRKLLEQNDLDAIVVATPDHTHAPATAGALHLKKPVYCEKPLTHTVYEARTLAKLAAEAKVATQMGTQIHAGANYRRVVELLQAGVIGPVKEVHTWVGKGWGGGDRPAEVDPVPPHIHWDLWLGPAPERPFNAKAYLPANWRRWWDFGGGTMADMACHHMDLPFWALKLRHPTTVEAFGPPVHAEGTPHGLKVVYTFAAREQQPALTLTWYDGNQSPKELHGVKVGGGGNLFVGEKGMLLADYGTHKLLPEDKFKDFTPPAKTIPDSIGHHREWLQAIRTGGPTTCNFDYSGALTEAVLLGNVAYRVGQKIEWDPQALKAKNCPDAEKYLRREYRKGWTL